ncbi:MAG TPA: anti-sigma regulatory factor [Haliangiales bacterium]|nr:anti-sigma regulatory factor [Haliangiales bacterium]
MNVARREREDTTETAAPITVTILSDQDIILARQNGRALAVKLGFSPGDLAVIAIAISELARNIAIYAGRGEIIMSPAVDGGRQGITVVARDDGPGIADVERALQPGYSTSGGLGLGLPGVRRLMDEFQIVSRMGRGTEVRVLKWNV